MSTILTETQKNAFLRIFCSVSFDDVTNFFELMQVPIGHIYSVAIEIKSRQLFDMATSNNVVATDSPDKAAIRMNDTEFYELVEHMSASNGRDAFYYAIETNNTTFIDYFLKKIPFDAGSFKLALAAINGDVSNKHFRQLIGIIDVKGYNTAVITNATIRKERLDYLKIVKSCGFDFDNNSLKIAVETKNIELVEFVLKTSGITNTCIGIYENSVSRKIRDVLEWHNISMI